MYLYSLPPGHRLTIFVFTGMFFFCPPYLERFSNNCHPSICLQLSARSGDACMYLYLNRITKIIIIIKKWTFHKVWNNSNNSRWYFFISLCKLHVQRYVTYRFVFGPWVFTSTNIIWIFMDEKPLYYWHELSVYLVLECRSF